MTEAGLEPRSPLTQAVFLKRVLTTKESHIHKQGDPQFPRGLSQGDCLQ